METSSPTDDANISTYVFIDFETTGLLDQKRNCKITELSLVAVDRIDMQGPGVLPRVVDKVTLCINPIKPISACSSRITGLYNDSLEQKKPFSAETVQFINLFLNMQSKPVCLLAHNGNRFDFPLLVAELKRTNQSLDDGLLCADTLEMYRSLDGLSPRYQPYSSLKVGIYTPSPGTSHQTTPNKQTVPIQKSGSPGTSNQTTPNKQIVSLQKSSSSGTSVESTPTKSTVSILTSPQKRKLTVVDDTLSNISPKIGRQSDDVDTVRDSLTEQQRLSKEKVKMALKFDDNNKLGPTTNSKTDDSVKMVTEVSNTNNGEKVEQTNEVRKELTVTAATEHLQEFSNSLEVSDYLQALDEVETSLYVKKRSSATKETRATSVPASVSCEPVSMSERTDVAYSTGYLVKSVTKSSNESVDPKVQNRMSNNEKTIETMTDNNLANNDDVITKIDDVVTRSDDVITRSDDVIKTGYVIPGTDVTVKEEPVADVQLEKNDLGDSLKTGVVTKPTANSSSSVSSTVSNPTTNSSIVITSTVSNPTTNSSVGITSTVSNPTTNSSVVITSTVSNPTTNSSVGITSTVTKPDISLSSDVTSGPYTVGVISKSSLSTLAGDSHLPTLCSPSTSTSLLASPVTSTRLLASPATSTKLLGSPGTSSGLLASPATSTRLLASPVTSTRLLASPVTSTRLLASPSTSSSGSPSGRYQSYKLEEIYLRKFGCKPPVSHCAEDDCIALVKVVKGTPQFMEWVDKHAVLLSSIPMPY